MNLDKVGRYLANPLHDDMKIPDLSNSTLAQEIKDYSGAKIKDLELEECLAIMEKAYNVKPGYNPALPREFLPDFILPLVQTQLSLQIIGRELFMERNTFKIMVGTKQTEDLAVLAVKQRKIQDIAEENGRLKVELAAAQAANDNEG